MRLTRQAITALRLPVGKPYLITWDQALPGFGVRVNPTNKVYVVQYRAAGKSRRETIGRVDTILLEQAREVARASLAKAQLGLDPQAEKTEAKARAQRTLGNIIDRYLHHARSRLKPRSLQEVERNLRKHWQSLHELPLDKVSRAALAARLIEISNESGKVAANRARGALSTLFTWAMGMGLTEMNPVVGTLKPSEEISRDRVLADGDLAMVWNQCREDDFGRIVRLLLLTAQRRDEVGDMTWSELNLDKGIWIIPGTRTKNGRTQEVPLAAVAVDMLREVPQRHEREFVFGEGAGGFSGWSKSKAALDKRLAKAGAKVEPWRLHDLRRTAATRMAEAGILPHVVEAILNHVSGHKAGVAGIYNRATYFQEKRAALNGWAEQVQSLRSKILAFADS